MSENDSLYGRDRSSYQMARKVTCDSRNVIYCISCTECSAPIYIGETGDRVYARMQNHLSRIRTRNTADPVGHHFNTDRHSIENFRFTVIEKVRENNYFYRTARELFWMKKLKTTESPGINKKE